jgi:hypothetical protein
MQMPMPKDPALHPALHRYVDAWWRMMGASDDVERDAAQRDLDAAEAELRAGGYYDEGGA